MGVSHIVAKKGISFLGGRGRFWVYSEKEI